MNRTFLFFPLSLSQFCNLQFAFRSYMLNLFMDMNLVAVQVITQNKRPFTKENTLLAFRFLRIQWKASNSFRSCVFPFCSLHSNIWSRERTNAFSTWLYQVTYHGNLYSWLFIDHVHVSAIGYWSISVISSWKDNEEING